MDVYINIDKDILENIDIAIDIDKGILENNKETYSKTITYE